MRIQNKQILASILFLLASFVCIAGPMPPPPGPPPPPGLPIDGFLIYAVALGLIFGVKKIISFNRNN